jgi:predicted GNAT family acetyltransferase
MTTNDGVVDDDQHHRFVYREDGLDARLEYRVDGSTLVLQHTEVPDALGGRGIAGRLVQAAVDRAAARGETVAPWCPYARRWLERHPDEAAAVTIDWSDPPAGRPGGPR